MKRTQFSMILANKRGELARLGEVLGEAGVNIEALSISDGVDTGVLKLVVGDPAAARAAFDAAQLHYSEQQILVVSLPNQPGALAELCGRLAAEGHSIDCIYGSTCGCGAEAASDCTPKLMLSVTDLDTVEAVEDAAWWPGPGH